MWRPAVQLVMVAALLGPGCGGDDDTTEVESEATAVQWEAGAAQADLSLSDGTVVSFDGGTCESDALSSGNDSFTLRIGEPGADGEGAVIGIGLELTGGATFAGDGSGNGVQVDHDGGRWGLAEGPEAIRFDDDLGGGTVELAGIETLGADADPRSGTLAFTC